MEWTGLNELREKYLSFFESKGHLRLDSFPLVPNNDNSPVDSTHVSSILFLQPVNTVESYILYTTILFYAIASIATIMSQYSDYHT